MAMEDNIIIGLYFDRDEKAIAATSEKYGNYCHAVARNILYNREDVEECVNDTYLKTWDSIPPNKPAVLKTFLGKITRNLAFDLYKRMNTEKRGALLISILYCFYGHNYAIIMSKKGVKHYATYYAY